MAKTPGELLDAILAHPRQYFSPAGGGTSKMKPGAITERELERRMYYTKPDEERAKRHHSVQEAAFEFALVLIQQCPNPSRELSLAISKLEEARMWGNAAIAHAQADEAVMATGDLPDASEDAEEVSE